MDPDCAFCRPSDDVRNYRINDALVNGADALFGMASFNFPICCHFLVMHSAWYNFITSADSYWIIQCGDYKTRTRNADIFECIRNEMLWGLRLSFVEYFIHTSASTSKGRHGVHSVCIIFAFTYPCPSPNAGLLNPKKRGHRTMKEKSVLIW